MRANPAELGSACNDFGVGLGFVKKSSSLQGTLSGANHCDPFAGKFTQIPDFVAVRYLVRVQFLECLRLSFEWADSRGNDHSRGAYFLSILQIKMEPGTIPVDAQNRPLIEIRTQLTTEPLAVVHERIERQRRPSFRF